ncbi:hypothetical protein HaLaN_19907 [Haematococcus lacustris]|uniref:Uncharacterized protein n=1 Tax=Haematococcus lacustris TaxID=44745 RepID=A0A699ZVZ1_HAELA|nr:hypothetical protein HaLaN_19907 [Haematococcus lacustris]
MTQGSGAGRQAGWGQGVGAAAASSSPVWPPSPRLTPPPSTAYTALLPLPPAWPPADEPGGRCCWDYLLGGVCGPRGLRGPEEETRGLPVSPLAHPPTIGTPSSLNDPDASYSLSFSSPPTWDAGASPKLGSSALSGRRTSSEPACSTSRSSMPRPWRPLPSHTALTACSGQQGQQQRCPVFTWPAPGLPGQPVTRRQPGLQEWQLLVATVGRCWPLAGCCCAALYSGS